MGKTYKTRPIRLSHMVHKPNLSTRAGNTSSKKREANPSKCLTTNKSEIFLPDISPETTIAEITPKLDQAAADCRTVNIDTTKTKSKSRHAKKAHAAEQRRQAQLDAGMMAIEPLHARAYGRMNRFERAMNEVMVSKRV